MRLCSRRRSDDLPLRVGGGSVATQRIESVGKVRKDREEIVKEARRMVLLAGFGAPCMVFVLSLTCIV